MNIPRHAYEPGQGFVQLHINSKPCVLSELADLLCVVNEVAHRTHLFSFWLVDTHFLSIAEVDWQKR